MSRILRRLYSTSSPPSSITAADAAAQFLLRYASTPPLIRKQYLDANQLQLLQHTLPPCSANPVQEISPGSPIPAGHHLVYFTPSQPLSELGEDGTDTSYNPAPPFTRRMWAGGELEWVQGATMKAGEEAWEETEVKSAAAKRTRAGEDMVVVGVEKRFGNAGGLSLVDRRNWIFRPSLSSPVSVPRSNTIHAPPPTVPLPSSPNTLDLIQTPESLFRFSALTFNGHKIHYNREWCREVEGHRDLVVHGPLNLICLIDFWRTAVHRKGEAVEVLYPKRVQYRNTSPVYANEMYRVLLENEREKVIEARIVDSFGKTAMIGTIEGF
ncbi:hypothetical protein BP5796_08181 [Coleophoma crateriformis]|uniref:N-terminal of MaoC-like dehydratase domain-containing protein n=1 Tax=Coleophoma crateriformis TaxID=565419 RepID=A0A3D8RDK9_9HELO|nr:hypothetical protein BP5796_08181 [Coleophoma crateriformis]